MKRLLVILVVLCSTSGVFGQETEFDITQYPVDAIYPDVPTVEFVTENHNLMRAFYPRHYDNEYKIRNDIRFVNRNDSALTAMWDSLGFTILTTMTSLSGINWVEDNVKLHLMKYLPTQFLYNPAAFPIEGIKVPGYVEVAPTGLHRLLNLIFLLSGRNIQQLFEPESEFYYLSDHPLLQESAYRFDVTAMTLAMAVAKYVIMPESLEIITESESWRRDNPGWIVYDNHFRYNWELTAETPLMTFLSNEPYNSALVSLTVPPRMPRVQARESSDNEPMRLSAGGGRLGFSVMKTPVGLLEVIDIDSLKLAFAAGIQVGDQIKRVNGEVVRTARDLMGKIIDKIDTDGVYMLILREDQEIGILLLSSEEF